MKKKVILPICILLVLLLAAGGWYLYTQHQAMLAEEARLAEIAAFYANPDVKLVVTEEDISQLDLYTDLKTVDLSGSTCYDAMMRFVQARPDVKVTYTVDLGGTVVNNDATSLDLAAADVPLCALAWSAAGLTMGSLRRKKRPLAAAAAAVALKKD